MCEEFASYRVTGISGIRVSEWGRQSVSGGGWAGAQDSLKAHSLTARKLPGVSQSSQSVSSQSLKTDGRTDGRLTHSLTPLIPLMFTVSQSVSQSVSQCRWRLDGWLTAVQKGRGSTFLACDSSFIITMKWVSDSEWVEWSEVEWSEVEWSGVEWCWCWLHVKFGSLAFFIHSFIHSQSQLGTHSHS